MEAFKKLGLLALDSNEHNLFSSLPTELMSIIAPYYCALGNKAWHAPHAALDGIKVYEAIAKNGPLTFLPSAPSNKRKAQDELKEEKESKKIKITEEMAVEDNSRCTIS